MSFSAATTEKGYPIMPMTSHLRLTKDDPLARSTEALRQALAEDYSDRAPQWVEAVDRALARVQHGLQRKLTKHSETDEWPTSIDPNTSRQVTKLCQSESDLLSQITHLRDETRRALQCSYFTIHRQAWVSAIPASADGSEDCASIRDLAAEVLAAVAKNSATETKLIQESVNTDIGGGD
jgi:hypothetical protein